MSRFLEALHSGRVLLMDGAMGTELQRAGSIQEGECYELWNLTHPEQVLAIHRAYVTAGAEVLLTNTFQANPAALGQFGLLTEVGPIIEAAMEFPRAIENQDCFVLYDTGPFSDETRRHAAGCVVGFAARGSVDALLVETCTEISDLARVLKHRARSGLKKKSLPVLLSWTFLRTPDGALRTFKGHEPESCVRLARKYDIAALGVNCGRDIGMDETIEIIRRYRAATDLPLFARPNAGTPTRVGDRWVYPLTPKSMAERLPELLEAGVRMVGGCCGTTPEHIAAMRPVVDEWNGRRKGT